MAALCISYGGGIASDYDLSAGAIQVLGTAKTVTCVCRIKKIDGNCATAPVCGTPKDMTTCTMAQYHTACGATVGISPTTTTTTAYVADAAGAATGTAVLCSASHVI